MKSFVLFIGLCLPFMILHAQERSLPGYIVRNSGDTLRGFLKEQGSDESARRISYKAAVSDNNFQFFTPAEVKAFQYDGGNLFRAITYSDTRKEEAVTRTSYGKVLLVGEYDLYTFGEDGLLYFLARKDSSFYLMFDEDLRAFPYVTGNYKNELTFFAVSCDAAKGQVDRVDYSIESMIAFFQKLDACVGPDKQVTSYYHKPKANASLYAYAGGFAFGNQSQLTAELRLKMVWPQVNPNMSFNLGLRYADITNTRVRDPYYLVAAIYHHETWQIKSLPLTVEYSLAHGVVQPFVFAGASLCTLDIVTDDPALIDNLVFYHRLAISPLAGVGLEVRIAPVLWARAEWRYECKVQSPTVGLAVTLP